MKIIIGAGGKKQENWLSTEQSQLDLLREDDFKRILNGALGYEAMLMEHCLEHLSVEDARQALENCYEYLSVGGHLRIAVPDGYHKDPAYIEYVYPPNMGHKFLYNYHIMTNLLEQAGFTVNLLEWWDENGVFHASPWNEIDGNIERCLATDPRNQDGKPRYTSLIIDAFKDIEDARPGLLKAFAFIEENDVHGLSDHSRRKATVFYELARLAPAGGVIVELGTYHGFGTVPLWYGAQDGYCCDVIAVDSYNPNENGWCGETYSMADGRIWRDNIYKANISPSLVLGDSCELTQTWTRPISLLIHDLGSRDRMPNDVMDWERYIIVGGLLAMRDIENYSMGTELAIGNLTQTGRWGKRRNWEALITSMERIK